MSSTRNYGDTPTVSTATMEPPPRPQEHEVPELIGKIGGMWAGQGLQIDFQQEVARLLHRDSWRQFPGAQPVSFAAQHLDELKKQDYFVCEKTDGLRVLLYMTEDNPGTSDRYQVTYLVDRRNDYYYVQGMRFPHHENNPDFSKYHIDTILDGELVEDKLPNGETVIKYLAFDCLMCDGKDMRSRPLDKRLAYLKEYILKPYTALYTRNRDEPRPFIVEDKLNQLSYHLPAMFHEIIPRVKQFHGNDGLIFTCRSTPYQSGTDPKILKWKPPHDNTVDFLMHIEWASTRPDPNDPDQSDQADYASLPAKIGLFTYHGRNQDYSYVADLFLTPQEWEDLKQRGDPLQDSIVECWLEDNGGQKRWRFYRMREDKDDANHVSVFESLIQSIEDHITEQDLLSHTDAIRNAWKVRNGQGGQPGQGMRPPH